MVDRITAINTSNAPGLQLPEEVRDELAELAARRLAHAYFAGDDLANGALPASGTLNSGQAYVVTHSGGTGFDIVDGALQSDVSLCYLNFGPLPGPVREFWLETSWSDDSEAAWEPAVMIVANGPFANNYPASYADAGLHLLVYGNRWILQKRQADGAEPPSATLMTWIYQAPLAFDERHRIGVVWDGNQISILHHEGIYTQAFDADVINWWGPYACMEIVGSTTGFNKLSVHSFHVSSEALPPTAALKSALEQKVDKTTAASQVYATTSGGEPTTVTVATDTTPNTFPLRYTDGRLKVGTPVDAQDAMSKAYGDAADVTKVDKTAVASQIYATTSGGAPTTLTGAAAATANSVAIRGTGGVLAVGTAVGASDAVTKAQHDTKADLASPALTGTATAQTFRTSTALNACGTTTFSSTAGVTSSDKVPVNQAGTTAININTQFTDTAAGGCSLANIRWAASTSAAANIFAKSRGATIGARAIVVSGDTLGNIGFDGDDGTNFVEAARISSRIDGTPGTADMPGRLDFSVTPDGSNVAVLAMSIRQDKTIECVGKLKVSGTAATFSSGAGSPEGVETAPVGSVYTRTDGGAGTTWYVKESGAGNTGWVAK